MSVREFHLRSGQHQKLSGEFSCGSSGIKLFLKHITFRPRFTNVAEASCCAASILLHLLTTVSREAHSFKIQNVNSYNLRLYVFMAHGTGKVLSILQRTLGEPQSLFGRYGEEIILNLTRIRTPTPRNSSP
jgi:hypothetical protein